jgi:hypothetical protein
MSKTIEVWECPVCGNHEIEIATYTRAGRPEIDAFTWATCLGCDGKGPVEDFLVYAEEIPDDESDIRVRLNYYVPGSSGEMFEIIDIHQWELQPLAAYWDSSSCSNVKSWEVVEETSDE